MILVVTFSIALLACKSNDSYFYGKFEDGTGFKKVKSLTRKNEIIAAVSSIEFSNDYKLFVKFIPIGDFKINDQDVIKFEGKNFNQCY